MEGLADKLVVLAVRADPEPMNAARDRKAKGAIVKADAHAVEAAAPRTLNARDGCAGSAFN